MTYADIANWAEKNVPMNLAGGSFSKWFSKVDGEFLNSGHFLPTDKVKPLLEKKWLAHNETLEPKGKEVEPVVEQDLRTISQKLDNRFERLPSGTEFNVKQITQWTGFNKNTVRRELQEFVKLGTIERVERGRYRIVNT